MKATWTDRGWPWVTIILTFLVVLAVLREPATVFVAWPVTAFVCGIRPLWDRGFPPQGSRWARTREFFTTVGPRQVAVLALVIVAVLLVVRRDEEYADFALLFTIVALPAAVVAYLLGWAIADRVIGRRTIGYGTD